MKREMHLTMKSTLILGLIIFIIGILMTYATILLIDYSKKADDTATAVIGLIGNIIGGLIGGIVAYVVAAFQVRSTIDHDGRKSVTTSYSVLRLVKSELVNNKNIIVRFKSDFANGNNLSHLQSLSSTYWDNSLDKLGPEVKDQTITSAQGCYAMIEAYKRQTSNIIENNSTELADKIDQVVSFIDQDIRSMGNAY